MSDARWPAGLPRPGTPNRWALFLDFDGTLVDIAPRPDAVQVREGLAELLTRLHGLLDGALAVVSGRAVAEIRHYLGHGPFAVAGLHGAELAHGDVIECAPADPQLEQVRARLGQFADAHGLLLEDKGVSMAVHYRDKPEMEALVLNEVETMLEALQAETLHALNGKCVVEVRSHHSNKGSILVQLMTMPEFAGRAPVFVGDDVTDEDGMRVALSLKGHAIKVGEGDSVATARLGDPAGVEQFLVALADHLESLT